MAINGVKLFSGGVFSTGDFNAQSLFSNGLFTEVLALGASGVIEIFVDGMFTDELLNQSAEQLFSFGAFRGALTPGGGGPELIWAHIMGQKRIQDQFIPI